MLSIHFLLDLAIILISTKVLGLITRRIQMPQVVGALAAGLLLGPAVFNIVHESDFINKSAELGVIVLMFIAGLETDLKELKRCGKASFIIALIGVVVPLVGGFAVAALFNNGGSAGGLNVKHILENIFIGIVLTATSVSITVETLKELGNLKTPSGTAILGAAVIDDILGIIALTIITSFKDSSVSVSLVLLKIIAFFAFAIVFGLVFYYIMTKLIKDNGNGEKRRFPIYGFAFCLVLSFFAEEYFGVADITGAYLAGIFISNAVNSQYIAYKHEVVSYMLLSPIFFASIGIKTTIDTMNGNIMLFTVALLLIAVLSKVIGCGIGAMIGGYSTLESLQIGVGMVSRGEVALIVADKGVSLGLMPQRFFTPLIIVVVVTTLITPVLLKLVYTKDKSNDVGMKDAVA